MSENVHTLVGAYALDAVSPEERDDFEQHLHTCATCREELGGLQATAARLSVAVATPRAPSCAPASWRRSPGRRRSAPRWRPCFPARGGAGHLAWQQRPPCWPLPEASAPTWSSAAARLTRRTSKPPWLRCSRLRTPMSRS
jgi:anti-sigma factor RsiW